MMIYRLSSKLGGRKEVLDAPLIELLGHLIQHREEEETKHDKESQERWINFLSMVHSHPSDAKRNGERQKFIDSITPRNTKPSLSAPKMETDFEALKRKRAAQKFA